MLKIPCDYSSVVDKILMVRFHFVPPATKMFVEVKVEKMYTFNFSYCLKLTVPCCSGTSACVTSFENN